jgi:hypothetical protein
MELKMRILKYIPERFIDSRTGCIQQDRDDGDRNVDSMYLTMNTAYQLDDDDYFDLKADYFVNRKWPEVEYFRYQYNEASGRENRDPRNLSRDNFIGMLICLGKFKHTKILNKIKDQIWNRGSFYQNTRTYIDGKRKIPDFAGPVTWAVIFKGLGQPNIFLLDLLVLFMASFAVVKSRIAPKVASTVYHEISTYHYLSTNSIATKLAWKLYYTFRAGVKDCPREHNLLSALAYYSRASYDPPIEEVTKAFLKKEGILK